MRTKIQKIKSKVNDVMQMGIVIGVSKFIAYILFVSLLPFDFLLSLFAYQIISSIYVLYKLNSEINKGIGESHTVSCYPWGIQIKSEY